MAHGAWRIIAWGRLTAMPNAQCPMPISSTDCLLLYNVCRGRSPPCQPRHRFGATTGGLTLQFHPFDARRLLEAGVTGAPRATPVASDIFSI
jgi:hypothetical protein